MWTGLLSSAETRALELWLDGDDSIPESFSLMESVCFIRLAPLPPLLVSLLERRLAVACKYGSGGVNEILSQWDEVWELDATTAYKLCSKTELSSQTKSILSRGWRIRWIHHVLNLTETQHNIQHRELIPNEIYSMYN